MEPTLSESPATRAVPYWHTALLVLVLLMLSVANALGAHGAHSGAPRLRIYGVSIVYEWLLTAYVWWGVRRSGGTLRALIGGRWNDVGDFLLDFTIAGGVWIASLLVIAVLAAAMGLGKGTDLEDARRQIGFLAPRSTLEIAVWFVLSVTAGFCEEVLFRGYLQKQFTHLLRNRWAALVIVSILFGLGHGYEGLRRMPLIALLGFSFGLLSIARGTLRPAMMAHALHDSVEGLLMRALSSLH